MSPLAAAVPTSWADLSARHSFTGLFTWGWGQIQASRSVATHGCRCVHRGTHSHRQQDLLFRHFPFLASFPAAGAIKATGQWWSGGGGGSGHQGEQDRWLSQRGGGTRNAGVRLIQGPVVTPPPTTWLTFGRLHLSSKPQLLYLYSEDTHICKDAQVTNH